MIPWNLIPDVQLEDDLVKIWALAEEDRESLRAIAFDPDIWRYFVVHVTTEEEFDRMIGEALADTVARRRVVFSIFSKAEGRIAGSMSFGNLAEVDRRLEIGWSWLGREFRGTGINRHAKFLLMQCAFEELGCERVEFKTDVLNEQARKGLLNIGATEEGVLRSYNYMPDNRRRDAVYYSVLRAEWPTVKAALCRRDRPR